MSKVCIIAEAGVNHNGNYDIAMMLVDEAKKAGADIVKFQTFNPDAITSRFAEMAEYQKKNIGVVKSQKEMLQELTLKPEEYIALAKYCAEVGIRFLSTPFDLPSIDFLESIGCDLWKIPSGEITNYPYLVRLAKTHKEIILSTGMSTLEEVEAAITLLKENGAGPITILHCTTQYPTDYEDVNLSAMKTLAERFGLPVGYSDHTRGIEVPVAAVAMGACVIEKHFTLNRKMQGPDHKASLEPKELAQMVSEIRHIEAAIGNGIKQPSEAERPNQAIARKSIVASRDIGVGEVFTEENITTKRPGNGISPMRWNEIIGMRAVRDFREDELIEV